MASLTVLVLLTILGVLLIVPIVRVVTRPFGAVSGPSCGACHYAVQGLGEGTCPECGADVHVVGIVTPRLQARLRGSLPIALVCWSLLALLIGSVLTLIVSMSPLAVRSTRSISHSVVLVPESEAFELQLAFSGEGTSDVIVGQVIAVITGPSGSEEITVQTGSLDTQWEGSGDPEMLGTVLVREWFERAGIESDDVMGAAHVGEATKLIKDLTTNPEVSLQPQVWRVSGGSNIQNDQQRSRWPSLVAVGLSLVVWVVGLFAIARRRRQLVGADA